MLQKVVEPVPFLDARWNQCRWPLWEKADDPQLVCGCPAVPGKSYCREHMERSRLRGHRGSEIVGPPSRRSSQAEASRFGRRAF